MPQTEQVEQVWPKIEGFQDKSDRQTKFTIYQDVKDKDMN